MYFTNIRCTCRNEFVDAQYTWLSSRLCGSLYFVVAQNILSEVYVNTRVTVISRYQCSDSVAVYMCLSRQALHDRQCNEQRM
jgi:hypothetical protein